MQIVADYRTDTALIWHSRFTVKCHLASRLDKMSHLLTSVGEILFFPKSKTCPSGFHCRLSERGDVEGVRDVFHFGPLSPPSVVSGSQR